MLQHQQEIYPSTIIAYKNKSVSDASFLGYSTRKSIELSLQDQEQILVRKLKKGLEIS